MTEISEEKLENDTMTPKIRTSLQKMIRNNVRAYATVVPVVYKVISYMGRGIDYQFETKLLFKNIEIRLNKNEVVTIDHLWMDKTRFKRKGDFEHLCKIASENRSIKIDFLGVVSTYLKNYGYNTQRKRIFLTRDYTITSLEIKQISYLPPKKRKRKKEIVKYFNH